MRVERIRGHDRLDDVAQENFGPVIRGETECVCDGVVAGSGKIRRDENPLKPLLHRVSARRVARRAIIVSTGPTTLESRRYILLLVH